MEQQEKLTVLLIEPECYPKTIEIEPGLEPLQKAVGGWIEAVYPWEDKAAIIVNEEGKLDQLPLNRALRTEDGEIYDITAGNMVIVGLGEEDFSSLTKDQPAHYEKLFHQPETFIRLGGHLMAIPTRIRRFGRQRRHESRKLLRNPQATIPDDVPVERRCDQCRRKLKTEQSTWQSVPPS